MKKVLEGNLRLLKFELETYRRLVSSHTSLPSYLKGIHEWLDWFYGNVARILDTSEQMLSKSNNLDLNNEVFRRLQIATRYLRFYNQYATAIHRYRESDKICYELINWLHKQHPIIGNKSFAIIDGNFQIYPDKDFPLLYFIPAASQHSLLHLPLFFHEIGHYFYILKNELMRAHLATLQLKLQNHFILPYQHNDKKYSEQIKKVAIIIGRTWPNWIQELFCDAVGVRIGGKAFLYAASHYLRDGGITMFYLHSKDIPYSTHPIPWLRMKFICRYATDLGLNSEADCLIDEWNKMAMNLKLKENYYGCYQDDYYTDVRNCIDSMIMEVNPILFSQHTVNTDDFDLTKHNFLSLLNLAWEKYHQDVNSYPTWENNIIKNILNSEMTTITKATNTFLTDKVN